jgi:L-threonylcarbamoyladenylate synthase
MLKLKMRILSLTKNSSERVIKESLKALKKGSIVAYPTESFYALGVMANDKVALKRLYEIKKRPLEKAMPVIVGGDKILMSIVKSIPPQAEKLMKKFWPGPLTIVFNAHSSLPVSLTSGTGKVAVRIPGDSFALYLTRAANFPITATSANPSGKPPAQSAEEVINYFAKGSYRGKNIDLVVDHGKTPGGKPSTIIDVTVTPPKVLRKGSIKRIRLLP